MAKLFLVVIGASLFCYVHAVEFTIEAESFTENKDRQTAKLDKGQRIKIPFCLRTDSVVNIKPQIVGRTCHLVAKIDGKDIAELESTTKGLINRGNSLSFLEGDITLPRGRHILTLSPEFIDVEIDSILLNVNDEQLTYDQLSCDVFCVPEIPKHNALPVESTSCARVEQRSFEGNCAESKNVLMDFYHENLKKFRITAQHPAYRSLSNARLAERGNCFVPKSTIWEFTDLDLTPKIVDGGAAVLEIKDNAGGCTKLNTYFNITTELHDINVPAISGTLEMEIQNHQADVALEIKVNVDSKELLTQKEMIYVGQNKITIPLADNTWSKLNNEVEILSCGGGSQYNISSLMLTRRVLNKEQGEKIYDDGEFVVEKVAHDSWWLGDPGMEVTIEGSDVSTYTHYIRVYTKVPWGGYSQNLVIYQDGNLRLLPPTTHGTDWIPFGSFVLSGRYDPKQTRTKAEIKKISINPETSEFTVTFINGNVWLYKLKVGLDKTEVEVEVVESATELSTLPFLQYRSMFIKDGRSNVDRLSVDGMKEHRILEKWSNLYGASFFFYRGCTSSYHTQSPDTQIQLLE